MHLDVVERHLQRVFALLLGTRIAAGRLVVLGQGVRALGLVLFEHRRDGLEVGRDALGNLLLGGSEGGVDGGVDSTYDGGRRGLLDVGTHARQEAHLAGLRVGQLAETQLDRDLGAVSAEDGELARLADESLLAGLDVALQVRGVVARHGLGHHDRDVLTNDVGTRVAEQLARR